MQLSTIFLIFRIVLGLGIGLYLSRKWQVPLRSIIVAMIPLRHRVSEKFVVLQTRISTALAFVLTFSIAFGVNHVLVKAAEASGIHQVISIWPKRPLNTDQAGITLTKGKKPAIPLQKRKKTSVELKEVKLPEEYRDINDNENENQKRNEKFGLAPVETKPIAPVIGRSEIEKLKRAAKTSKPTSGNRPLPEPEVEHYVQLCALSTLEKALAQQRSCQRKCQESVWVAYSKKKETSPFKVLVGPFYSREEAKAFLRKHRWKGYALELGELLIFQDS